MTLTPNSVVLRNPDLIGGEIDHQLVLLSVASSSYFAINRVGVSIWRLLERPTTISGIVDALVGQFEVTPETCEAELISFLTELRDAGLINVVA